MIETIEEHQNKLQKAIQEQEYENIDDLLEACIHRIKKLLPRLSNMEIKKQCLISQKKVLEISNIKKGPYSINQGSEEKTKTNVATGSRRKRRHTKKHKKRKKLNKRKTLKIKP
jgi:hypothetical protein